jgi:hypothetical protein
MGLLFARRVALRRFFRCGASWEGTTSLGAV